MKRIPENRCGYDGYTCKPIGRLNQLFAHTYTSAFSTVDVASGTEAGHDYRPNTSQWVGVLGGTNNQGVIDNYSQLPQAFEGFRMTLTPIIDMSGTSESPEVPELDCRVTFDPFATDVDAVLNTTPNSNYTYNPATIHNGFLDFYNQVNPSYFETVYVDVEGATSLLFHNMPAYLSGSTVQAVDGIGYEIIGTEDNPIVSLTAGPGILDPMLDTELPAIGIDTIPSADIIGDFAMWEFNTINQWQKLVDARLNGMKAVIPKIDYGGVTGLYNLKNAEYQKGNCVNFRIQEADFSIPVIGSTGMVAPTYTISGGTIYLNNRSVSISGTTTDLSVFAAYLDIEPSGTTGSIRIFSTAGVPEGSREAGHTYVYIGQVAQIDGLPDSPIEGGTAFTLYKIEQGDCIDELRTNYDSSDEYAGPFVVLTGSSNGTPYFYVSGFDGTESAPLAGKIYLNGSFLNWGPVQDLTGTGTESFVYAHITLTASDSTAAVSGYTLSDCSYDRTETVAAPSSTTSIVYTIRLGRILSDNSVNQLHFGDIYLYTGASSQQISVRYTGPFHVVTGTAGGGSADGLAVEGTHGDPLGQAGKIFINGTTSGIGSNGNVENVILPCDVYANVYLTKTNNNKYAVASCGYSTVKKTDTTDYILYNVRLARAYRSNQDILIEQTHFGDIYIDMEPATTAAATGYSGPFSVSVDSNGTYHVTCPDCGVNASTAAIVGWYSINGQYETEVTGTTYSGPVGTADAVYFHKTAANMWIDTSAGNTTDPTDYTVRLARISGGTAYQLHFGNIFIDGRWIDPEPPPPYTVTAGDGTGEGSLFSALSARSDPEIYIDASLNGQPLDFNGASVL